MALIPLLIISVFAGIIHISTEPAKAPTVILGGPITSDTTWTVAGSPYLVQYSVRVVNGVTLTIEPGVWVKFRKDFGQHLFVDGSLIADGTPSDMIDFTSNESSPASKDWGNIWINSTGSVVINYCNFTYGNYPVFLFYASYVNVTNSIFMYNEAGIGLVNAHNNTIRDNLMPQNKFASINLDDSQNNTIVNNTLSLSQQFGVMSQNSINNRIYHNNFIDNLFSPQAEDDSNGNFWNDAYPSGGNYWNDYDEVAEGCIDNYDGPVTPQTTGFPDGICDDPYIIDADSIDYYPLTKPISPQIAPPFNLSAELTGDNLENVTISWDASLDDPFTVINYAVYYSTTYNTSGSNYGFLIEFPAAGASTYYLTIIEIGEGNPNNYFFYVQANATFSIAKNDTQVAKFTRSLTTGMHLISIPLVLSNTNISKALQTLDFEIVWFYDNADPLNPWKSYNPLKSFNDLMTINHTMALWTKVTGNSNLTVAGIVPKMTTIELKAGWNFVGYPSFIERTVADALGGVNYERIEGYFQSPPEYLRIYSDDDFLAPSNGYWVKVNENALWTLEN